MTTIHDVTREAHLRARAARERADREQTTGETTDERAWYRRPLGRSMVGATVAPRH